MSDQAQRLRDLLNMNQGRTKVLTITSGKGGVGKSNFTINFALSLKSKGYDVVIFDADIGMANIDVLMGVRPKYSLYHVLTRQKSLKEIMYQGHHGVKLIAGGSGFQDLLHLTEEQLEHFTSQIMTLHGQVDYILFDTGAGLSKETLKFILSADETIIVTTPEPTAVTDAYALVKMIHQTGNQVPYQLVVNRVSDPREGQYTANKISMAVKRFLNVDIQNLGFIQDDPRVSKAVKNQIPFTMAYPNGKATKGMEQIVDHYVNRQAGSPRQKHHGIQAFLSKLLRHMNMH